MIHRDQGVTTIKLIKYQMYTFTKRSFAVRQEGKEQCFFLYWISWDLVSIVLTAKS